jgi:AraC family transcriptional regulator, transcriptional activator of pobA
MQWIEDRRMLEARRLLLATDDKVDGVAERVGYRDPSYFRRRFRRAHGVPPQAWRERTR